MAKVVAGINPIEAKIRDILGETELSRRFQTYAFNKVANGQSILKHMVQTYQANYFAWWNVGAFVENYLETVVKVASAHVPALPPFLRDSGTTSATVSSARDVWYEDIFNMWASIVRDFAFGEGNLV